MTTPSEPSEPVDAHGAAAGVDDPVLAGLLRDDWDRRMRAFPVWATRLGDHRFDDRMEDRSPAGRAARDADEADVLARVEALDPGTLTGRDQVTRALFVEEGGYGVGEQVCRFAEWSVSARYNALVRMESMIDLHPRGTDEDVANLRTRLGLMPTAVEQEIEALEVGRAEGLVANAESITRVVTMIDAWLVTPEIDQEPHAVEAWDVLAPAFVRYRDYLRDTLLPDARDDEHVGLAHLPIGEACYGAVIANFTNQDRSPDAIHQRGLDELARIHGEFEVLGESLWGVSDKAAIFDRLRTDPELYFATEDEVEDKARSALARASEAMPSAFGRLPEAECTVERIPELEAPFTTIAYYRRPAPDGGRPGTYFVNTNEPTTRPRHEAEVLAFHESIPGHHLQIAIAQELGDLPAFRRNTGSTAFVEGWGLYTERLSDEMGLYSGDLDRMGMLSFDSWRAARLVVDTGLHHHGWSRRQAVAFLVANTPLPLNNIDNEVDRYITNPGQALAYKTGQLEILDLRAGAREALGDRFDLRAFHDELLGGGAVTLGVLRTRMERWIEAEAR